MVKYGLLICSILNNPDHHVDKPYRNVNDGTDNTDRVATMSRWRRRLEEQGKTPSLGKRWSFRIRGAGNVGAYAILRGRLKSYYLLIRISSLFSLKQSFWKLSSDPFIWIHSKDIVFRIFSIKSP